MKKKTTQSHTTPSQSVIDLDPIPDSKSPDPKPHQKSNPPSFSSNDPPKPSSTNFEYWDEDEIEGLPVEIPRLETPKVAENSTPKFDPNSNPAASETSKSVVVSPKSYIVEIVGLCTKFLMRPRARTRTQIWLNVPFRLLWRSSRQSWSSGERTLRGPEDWWDRRKWGGGTE